MKFTKMQGLGNDYLYIYGEVPEINEAKSMAVRYSDRHFGAGSDGIIWISKSETADFMMRIFNADGSEALMCGNGIRCVGKYVYDKGYTRGTELDIETLSGIKHLKLFTSDGKVSKVSVDMGKGTVRDNLTISGSAGSYTGRYVDVGNPHFVIFTDNVSAVPLSEVGPVLENSSEFKDRANIEFVEVTGRNRLRMRVWERGSGITMACGTGACASAIAALDAGLCDFDKDIAVMLDGGELTISVSEDYMITMTGPCETVYEGEI